MSAPQTALHLLTPPPPDHLRDRFPAFTIQAGMEVFRCHSAARGPLWFANGGHGRFDLADTYGTCYTAESEQITLLETWGGMRVVPSTELAARAVTRLDEVAFTRALADLTSNSAAQFGVIAEIFSTGNYHLTQLWASPLSAGYAGIRYWARHDLAHSHACLALFGAATAHSSSTDPIGAHGRDTGISVLPVTPSL